MKRQAMLLLTLSLLPIGCTQFHTSRTYLSEMEHDDTSFFNPREDFPIVAGDTGKDWASAGEMKARTPRTEDEIYRDHAQKNLKAELRSLEETLDEREANVYEKHKPKLATISEKIYYLKLPRSERLSYLESRGFLDRRAPASIDQMFGVRRNDITLGMSKLDVRGNLGEPERVEVAGNPSYENERWLYRMNGSSKYIYFESGRVDGWE